MNLETADAGGLRSMTRRTLRYSPVIFISAIVIFLLRLVLSSTDVMSETMLEARPIELPNDVLGTSMQRLIEKQDELDKKHILREKVISELKQLLVPDGYRTLDLGADDVVARLYLIANVHPAIVGDLLSYHKNSVSQDYLGCLQAVESRIRFKAYPSGSGGTKCSDGCGLTA